MNWQFRVIIRLWLSGLLLLSAVVTSTSAANVRSTGSLRSMARIYMASGGYDKAQPLLESALALAKRADASDSEMCACVLDLAFLYKNQGRLAEAEEMCRLGLELQKKVNGPNHPHVAHTLRIMSQIYQGQVRYDRAADSLEQGLAIMRKVGGEDGVEIAPLRVDMARLLVTQGQFTRAESLFAEALVAIESSYGPEHAYTAKVLASMAALYERQGRHGSAEELTTRAYAVLEKVYGANHHFLVPTWLVMSGTHQARGELAEARALLDRSLAVTTSRADCGRSAECDVLIRLGEFHILCEDYRRAELALRKAQDILDDSQCADGDRTAAVLNNMAIVRMNQGKHDRAQALCLEALNILERIFDEHHPIVADVLETLATSHRLSGDDTEAGRLEKHAERIRAHNRLNSTPDAVTI